MYKKKSTINVSNEAVGLLDFFGGNVPLELGAVEKCRPYFENRSIPEEYWFEIYNTSLQYQLQP